jgi:Transposase and inactivated derivatives
MKNLFIGIDFSKKTFDVSFFEGSKAQEIHHEQFMNDFQGYGELIRLLKRSTKVPSDEWLFCGEHTGLYGISLTEFLLKKGLFIWLENPLQIKLSTGVKREKNDKADSLEIARYAYRFHDRAVECRPTDKDITSLRLLLSFRERLIRNKKSLLISAKEMRSIYERNRRATYVYEQSMRGIKRINKEIKETERQMLEIISSSPSLEENYDLATSVKGIALINTVAIMVHTDNFTRFDNARQFACYAGVVPFGKSSGTSLNSPKRTSSLANKQIRALLTQAALCAIIHDNELRSYYNRKVQEGKDRRLVINNVKNKLVHRIFAVVKNKIKYQANYQNTVEDINEGINA